MQELEELRALLDEIEQAPLLQKATMAQAALKGIVDALEDVYTRLAWLDNGGRHAR